MDGSIDQVLNFNKNQISFHLKALIVIKDDEIVRVVIEIWRERVRIHPANFLTRRTMKEPINHTGPSGTDTKEVFPNYIFFPEWAYYVAGSP